MRLSPRFRQEPLRREWDSTTVSYGCETAAKRLVHTTIGDWLLPIGCPSVPRSLCSLAPCFLAPSLPAFLVLQSRSPLVPKSLFYPTPPPWQTHPPHQFRPTPLPVL